MKVEISLPKGIEDLKLSQYQKFIKIAEENEESEFLHHKMIEIFCGVDLKIIPNVKYKNILEVTSLIANLFNRKYPLVNRFKIGTIEFGFIPNLEEMTTGEYMDLDTYITDWSKMHKAMAVLYRPITSKIGDKYKIEEYKGSDEYSEIMKSAPLNVVFGCVVFFYHLGNELLKSTLTYLEENQEVMNTLNKANLGKDGDGIHLSMLSLKEMLEDLMKLPNFQLINP
jgi:hypothetical protein